MDASAQSYQGIVVDASFFVRPFSEEFKQILANTPVYCAQTWENTVTAMRYGLEEPHKRFYADNLNVLNPRNPQPPAGVSCTEDVMGLLLSLASLGAAQGQRYLFASADRILIQRLVLEQVQVDIYDLWTDRCVNAEDFPKAARNYEFTQTEWEQVLTADTAQDELTLYNENGMPVRLKHLEKDDDDNTDGAEARIYACQDRPELLAKIYKKRSRSLTKGKIRNIEKLQEKFGKNPGFSWAKVPRERLYLEPERRNVVGFLMEKIGEVTLLDELDLLNQEQEDIEIWKVVRLCWTLIRQVACLSIYGFCVYDYNDNNFSYSHSQPDRVQMMDTDSFCGGDYFIAHYGQNLNLRRKYVPGETTKVEALQICTELAYLYAGFMLLRRKNAMLPKGLREADDSLWRRMPENMKALLFRVFGGKLGYLPQYDLLISELMKAEKVLSDEARNGNPRTYRMVEEDEQGEEDEDIPYPSSGPEKRFDKDTPRYSDVQHEEDWVDPDAFDEFEVDDRVFQPTDRMLIRQAPPAEGPRKRENTREYYFAPAPLRELYGQREEKDQADRDAARWQSVKRGMKIAAVVFAVLFACWWLFAADPDWLPQLRETVFGVLEWLGSQWESLMEALGGLVEKIGQWLRP